MVKLTKIYTRTGDDGSTGLGDGARVPKNDPRVDAYGIVDEANATVGEAVLRAEPGPLKDLLVRIQNDLFDVGADFCMPADPSREGPDLRVTPAQTKALEQQIDSHNEHLAPLTSFILPGGTPLACALHLARTVTRRAEREAVALSQAEPDGVNPEAIRYLNRLSDLLFVLARVANGNGAGDVLWVPGGSATVDTARDRGTLMMCCSPARHPGRSSRLLC